MNRLSSFLAMTTLVATGSASHEMSPEENMYTLDTFGEFMRDFENAWAMDAVTKLPTCVDNAVTYMAMYTTMACTGTAADCTDPDADTACCHGMTPWESPQQGCEMYDGVVKDCCLSCIDSSYPGFPFECTQNPAEFSMGTFACDMSPLPVATAPLPAGVICEADQVVINGTYKDENGVTKQAPNCDFLEDLAIEDGMSGYAAFAASNNSMLALMETGAMLFRPVNANGDVLITVDSLCNVFLSPHVNGKLEVNPTNSTPAEDMNPVNAWFNATIYPNNVIKMNQGNYYFMGGKNGGEMQIDTPREAQFRNFSNPSTGILRVDNSMEFSMNNISNNGLISAQNVEASIKTVHIHPVGKMEFDGGRVMAVNMTNEGEIVIKSGTKCILEFYMNYGIVTIEDGAECDVYINVNEHSGAGTFNFPANGVTMIHGDYVRRIELPLAEAFGQWTTGAYRAGKSRWVGDKAIEHGDCDQLRFNTLGMRSIVQSPSNKTFNAVVEITHPKRQMNVDMTYINVTLYDKNDMMWHFSRYLFEDSDIITHLELPNIDMYRTVHASMKNFRVLVTIDFDELEIPFSQMNDVEITMFSLRQGQDGQLKMDALDCVQLHDVGVAHYDMVN